MQTRTLFKLHFVQENGSPPSFEYIRLQRSKWHIITGENEAVALILLIEGIAATGPRGTVESDGSLKLYIADDGRHRISHAPHPEDPYEIFILAGFDKSDLTAGLNESWRLLYKALGLIP